MARIHAFYTGTCLIAFSAFLLAACGDTVENVNQMGMNVVSSVDDLPKCTDKNEGEQALVKGETSVRVCVDGEWFATKSDEGGATAPDFSCKTEELKDGSGLKIVCNGDSIGVVLNGAAGKDGEDGEDGQAGAAADGCVIVQDGSLMAITCNGETMRFNMDEEGNVTVDTTVLDSEMIAISLDSVSGVSQKGPFLSGSKVIVNELANGRTLAQTGKSFDGKILNDKGEFRLKASMLVSQYLKLEATGYYRNEETGEPSSSPLTLYAITDARKRNVVNINLLTHLEFERVMYLVTIEKKTVKKAKKQAQQEIFGMLGIDASGFSNSEDLSIVGTSDEDGALLAFSVMFQGGRTEAELTELLTKIATDIEEDGKWDDAKTRMAIAEWSADADSSYLLARIRRNVEGWGLSLKVPKFEPFVRNFWYMEYGLDSCKKAGVVKAATAGKRKGTKTRYICKDVDGQGDMRWVIASDIEKDAYEWKDAADGTLKSGDVTGKKYVFDETGSLNGNKGWREAVNVENVYGGCTEALYDSIRSYRGTNEAGYYQWVLTNNNLMIDTQGWSEGDDGFSKWGDSIGVVSGGNRICYVYDTSAAYGGWRKGNDNDCTLGLMGCTKGRAGVMSVANNGDFYNCANEKWTKEENARIIRNTKGWACLDSNEGEMKLGLYNPAYFICDDHSWREATTNEELACRDYGQCTACTGGLQGKFKDMQDTKYVCDEKQWRLPNCAELATESLCTKNDSALVPNCEQMGAFKIDYVCSEYTTYGNQKVLKWHAVQNPFEYTLGDWNAKRDAYNLAALETKPHSDSMITDPRDLKTYRTVVINGKRLFAENLQYTDSAVNVNLKGQISCYNDESKNCEIGGAFYTWTAAVDLDSKWQNGNAGSLINNPHQGICPKGWHIPNASEWRLVFGREDKYAQEQMMGFGVWPEATDASGLSALPVYREYSGKISRAGFWSVSSRGLIDIRLVESQRDSIGSVRTSERLSIRCFQNDPVAP